MAAAGPDSSAGQLLVLRLYTLSGALCTIEVANTATVRELKAAASPQLEIPAWEQQIVCGTAILHDPARLSAYGPALREARDEAGAYTLSVCRVARARIFALGGGIRGGGSAEVYDPSLEKWSPLPQMSSSRHGLAAAVLGSRVIALGGENNAGCILRTVEAYDAQEDTWSALPDMTTERYNHAAAASDDRLFVAGGINDSGILGSVESYDLAGASWSLLPSMRTPRHCHALVAIGRAIYAVGGLDGESCAISSLEALLLGGLGWTLLPGVGRPRYSLAAAVAGDCIFVLGGNDDDGRALRACEAYDVGAGAWRDIPDMHVALANLGSPLPDLLVPRSLLAAAAL